MIHAFYRVIILGTMLFIPPLIFAQTEFKQGGSELSSEFHPSIAPIVSIQDSACVALLDTVRLQQHWYESLKSAGFDTVMHGDAILPATFAVAQQSPGICKIKLSLQPLGFDAQLLEISQVYSIQDTATFYRLTSEGAAVLYRRYLKTITGSLNMECLVQKSMVTGIGSDSLGCPGQYEAIKPGRYAVTVGSSLDWNPILDTIEIFPGKETTKSWTLTHSQAYLDSVKVALEKARRDSVLAYAAQHPATSMPELFQRLLSVTVPAGIQTVAVIPFGVVGSKPSDYDPGNLAAEYATVRIAADPRFRLVERQNLNRILEEQALMQSDLVSDSVVVSSGKLLAARYLILGSVTIQGSAQTVFARLVDVESGTVLNAVTARSNDADLRELYLNSIGERTQVSSTIFRSAVAPGWGQFYAKHPTRGAIWSGLAIASIGYTTWRILDFKDKESTLEDFKDHDPSTVHEGETEAAWQERAQSAQKDRNTAATQLNIALGVLGTVWIANLVDAWWLGSMESKRIQTQYFKPQIAIAPISDGSYHGILLAASF